LKCVLIFNLQQLYASVDSLMHTCMRSMAHDIVSHTLYCSTSQLQLVECYDICTYRLACIMLVRSRPLCACVLVLVRCWNECKSAYLSCGTFSQVSRNDNGPVCAAYPIPIFGYTVSFTMIHIHIHANVLVYAYIHTHTHSLWSPAI